MHELDTHERGRSTGPTTPQGKATSSQNAITHGCRSKTKILWDESQDDYDALSDRWMAEFEPDDDAALHFVEQIILNDWLLQRTIRRYNAVEEKFATVKFIDWTEEQHKTVQLSLRYKGEAGRGLDRAIRAAESWRKNRNQETRQIEHDAHRAVLEMEKVGRKLDKHVATIERTIESAETDYKLDLTQQKEALDQIKAERRAPREKTSASKPNPAESPKTAAQLLFSGQKSPKKQKKIHVLEQWVEITVEDGKTVTKLVPNNEGLIERGQRMFPPPDLVYRRLNFLHSVPSEYHWTTDDPEVRRIGGHGIQRMTVDTWLEAVEKEKGDPAGHIGPTPDGNLPRPQERGGCDCPVCTTNQAILDRRAEEQRQQDKPLLPPFRA